MLGRRLAAAAIIISVLLLLIWIDFQIGSADSFARPGLVLGVLAIILAGMAAGEIVEMFRERVPGLSVWLGAIGASLMVAVICIRLLWSEYPPDCPVGSFGWGMAGLVGAIVIVFLHEMRTYDPANVETRGIITLRIAVYVFAFGYLLMLFGFVIPHRILNLDNGQGMVALIALISTVKLSDSFAYFAGKTFGKRKIAPNLSPNKTLAGAVGAVLGGWVAAAIVVFLVAPYIFGFDVAKPWYWFLLYGFLVTLAGMVGDLAESLLKRDAGVKDSSKWLPGLGGILDIMDSLIFAAPVSFFLWV